MEVDKNDMALHKERGLRELALFAGAGGGILGGLLHGWRTVAAVEIEDYPRRVLLQRQADGILPRFPIWDDVCTFDGKPWRGKVDVVSGGFPCQDISAAGKGEGIEGARSGLWKEMARIIGEVRPRYAFVENSPMLISRGLTAVLGGFAEMGYDARWCVLGARDAGAPHKRERCWIMADSMQQGLQGCWGMGKTISNGAKKKTPVVTGKIGKNEWIPEPSMDRLVDGFSNRVDMCKAAGNAQVPQVVAMSWELLNG